MLSFPIPAILCHHPEGLMWSTVCIWIRMNLGPLLLTMSKHTLTKGTEKREETLMAWKTLQIRRNVMVGLSQPLT
jgi:hypothetical protein